MRSLFLALLLVVMGGCASKIDNKIPCSMRCDWSPNWRTLEGRMEWQSEQYRAHPNNLIQCDDKKGIDYSICVLHDKGHWEAIAKEARYYFKECGLNK